MTRGRRVPALVRLAGGSAAVAVMLVSPAAESAQRTSKLVVYGNDPCPKSSDDEIVVCAKQPESERYRIPKELREKLVSRAAQSWASRAATLDQMSRAGMPDSCSVVGTGGQTGCAQQMMREWRAARKQMEAEADGIP